MPTRCLQRHRQRRRKQRTAEPTARPVAQTSGVARQRRVAGRRKTNLHPWAAKEISRLQGHRIKPLVSAPA